MEHWNAIAIASVRMQKQHNFIDYNTVTFNIHFVTLIHVSLVSVRTQRLEMVV